MPTVFLSYSRVDLPLIEQLEAQLKSHPDISIWRDQEKIYGGQKWPKVLGETIADQDIFLLAWSKNSADSHFVEFEWTTALALKKTVVPCLLDSTPLSPSLRAAHAIPINDPLRLIAALTGAGGTADARLRTEVVSKLEQIAATEPQDALQAAKTFFDQRNWMVQGSVIQGENVTVHIRPEIGRPAKSLAEKWQVWVGVVVGLLTVVTLAMELPRKMNHTQPATTPKPVEEAKSKHQTLSGAIRSEENDPLPNVRVSLPKFNLETTTDQFGQFRFEVTAPPQETIALLAQKPGYETYEADVSLGNTVLGFTMRKKP